MTEQKPRYEDWQQWGKHPKSESRYNQERIEGNLPAMECTKQLVKIISKFYSENSKILDVGCNVGHYLKAIRKRYPNLDYTGIDAYETYIKQAKKNFILDSYAEFEVKDIFKPLFPKNPFDIVFCCNVLLHLPDFREPIKNLLESTRKVCIIRTLIGDLSTIVKSSLDDKFDNKGNPTNYFFMNTWGENHLIDYIKKLGWNVEIQSDEFNSELIQKEHDKIKTNEFDTPTRVVNGKQIIQNIILNWKWAVITKP